MNNYANLQLKIIHTILDQTVLAEIDNLLDDGGVGFGVAFLDREEREYAAGVMDTAIRFVTHRQLEMINEISKELAEAVVDEYPILRETTVGSRSEETWESEDFEDPWSEFAANNPELVLEHLVPLVED